MPKHHDDLLEPKVVEWMVNKTTLRWQVRFWFDASKVPFDFALAKVNEWATRFNPDRSTVDLTEMCRLVKTHFHKSSAISACEILDPKKNGVVLYFDWP